MTTNLSRNVGPAWLVIYDDNPNKDLAEKIARAAQEYVKRHGHEPDTCRVLPSALGGAIKRDVGDIEVTGAENALRHHFWLRRA